MTREEEILSEAKKYYSDNIRCYDAFLHGVEFAEERQNIWHDASEMPDKQGNLLYILPQGSLHISNIPSTLRTCKLDKVRWEEYVKELGIIKWAYISDILPKRGEE